MQIGLSPESSVDMIRFVNLLVESYEVNSLDEFPRYVFMHELGFVQPGWICYFFKDSSV